MTLPIFQPLKPGDVFLGEYTVRRLLGAGGMGAVYQVIDEQGTQANFALKVMQAELAKSAEFRHRFSIEARIPAGLASDHIVRVIRTGIDDGTGLPFILMELLNGVDLGKRISPGGRANASYWDAPSRFARAFGALLSLPPIQSNPRFAADGGG